MGVSCGRVDAGTDTVRISSAELTLKTEAGTEMGDCSDVVDTVDMDTRERLLCCDAC